MRHHGEVFPDNGEVEQLVRDAQQGGEGALEAFLTWLRPLLVKLFERRIPADDAEDLAQIALLRVAGALRHIDPERATPYVVTVARNLLWSERRRLTCVTQRSAPVKLADDLESPFTADREVEYRDLVCAIHRTSFARLPPELRDAVLGLLDGRSPVDMAAQQRVKATTIRRRLRRARASLRDELRL